MYARDRLFIHGFDRTAVGASCGGDRAFEGLLIHHQARETGVEIGASEPMGKLPPLLEELLLEDELEEELDEELDELELLLLDELELLEELDDEELDELELDEELELELEELLEVVESVTTATALVTEPPPL
ncbi:MAG: hypothetical protein IPP19_13525 [Verrucomicrobia bacterium]|nr:hypothetical protein [Verrucomicrobiota bacterium]